MLYMYCLLCNVVMMYIVKKVGMCVQYVYGEVDVYFELLFVDMMSLLMEVIDE